MAGDAMRAPITRIGVCEPLPDDVWFVKGWVFQGTDDPAVLHRGCPYVHDAEDQHIGLFGWLFTDLADLSAAQRALSDLQAVDRGI
jgi:hypothetical protein